MSKYDKLWNYVKDNNLDCYKLSYDKIKEILGFDIDHSFLKYKNELISYGYIVKKISKKAKICNYRKELKYGKCN